MKSRMTFGKKLVLAYGGLVTLLLGVGYSSLDAIAVLGRDLSASTGSTARTIQIGGSMQATAFDMRATSRAIVLSAAMKESQDLEIARQRFREQGKNIQMLVDEIRPLLASEAARQATDRVQADLGIWMPIVEEIGRLCQDVRIAEADALRKDKQRVVADRLAASAKQIIDANQEMLAAAAAHGAAIASRSRWTAAILIGLSFGCGIVVLFVVRQVNRDLRRTVDDLSQGAVQTASAANQVSSSSQSLAQGSSEQAASLEETSASSEQINSMARSNTANSRAAVNLVLRSQEKFDEANRALNQTVAAMGEINAQSGKISKIIKVIDEIAFQTNILALNAAVEAARAGESGLGFAVVADEVRNLSQRCAQAACDTAELIEESIVRSKEGKTRVDEVADVIRIITGESAKVKALVDDVNQGSQEQARGIEQIALAITQMERVTQSTAANAEQSAAAAEQLNAQSETLKHIVGRLSAMVG